MLKIKFLPIVLGAVIAACGLASRPAEAIPWVASVQIQSDNSIAFREAEAGRGAENGDGESSVGS